MIMSNEGIELNFKPDTCNDAKALVDIFNLLCVWRNTTKQERLFKDLQEFIEEQKKKDKDD